MSSVSSRGHGEKFSSPAILHDPSCHSLNRRLCTRRLAKHLVVQIRAVQRSRKEDGTLRGRFVCTNDRGKLEDLEQVGQGLTAERRGLSVSSPSRRDSEALEAQAN